LSGREIHIDTALVSPAARTVETFERVFAAFGHLPRYEIEPRIYEANVQSLLDVVREQNSDTVMLVGHGPGIPQLSLLLADDFDSEPAIRIRQKYPTAAIAVLHSAAEWAEWGPGTCVLEDFLIPRANPSGPDQD
jgi:phosphohistidine phosphatase